MMKLPKSRPKKKKILEWQDLSRDAAYPIKSFKPDAKSRFIWWIYEQQSVGGLYGWRKTDYNEIRGL